MNLQTIITAERAVIGALLYEPERFAEFAEALKSEHFFDSKLRAVYAAMTSLAARSAPIDFVTVGAELDAKGHLVEVGGKATLVELANDVVSAAHLTHHVGIVQQASRLRAWASLATLATEQVREVVPGSDEATDLLGALEAKALSINSETGYEPKDISVILPVVKAGLLRSRSGGVIDGLATGISHLDRTLCGLQKGDLIVVAARPGMGKTAFALNLIKKAVMGTDGHALFASLEMGHEAIVRRMLCEMAGVSAQKLRSYGASESDKRAIEAAEIELERMPFTIDDRPAQSPTHLKAMALRTKRKKGLSLIVIDYLQLMRVPRSKDRYSEVSEVSRSLKELAREMDVPVVALSQLSRAVDAREQKRPTLSDLRESGAIEQDADIVSFLYRPSYYEPDKSDASLAEVIVAKNRNGPTGTVEVHFNPELMRFSNREPRVEKWNP